MSIVGAAIRAGEGVAWPDPVLRAAVRWLVGRTQRRLSVEGASADRDFARQMAEFPIAINTSDANAQHYEVPAEFFRLMLGPQRKYSCCYYKGATDTLADAEENALAETAQHAALADGQQILELGCGWGSLSLWMARNYPASRITAVSNSHSQRIAVERRAASEGLSNLSVVTADMNSFAPQGRFDRIVSVEMFEHMSNWRALLERAASWLTPEGALFLHVFAHRSSPYRFETADRSDWIAQHFFTGGIMPSRELIQQFRDVMQVEQSWWWNGSHYRRTATHWLENFDRNAPAIETILQDVYGPAAPLWKRRWRLFLLATEGLFGYGGGEEWGVSHYRLRPAR
jgi:cyclopropane-fatty-acyl-phospholipid synthase